MSDTLGDAVSHHAAALDDPNEGRPTVSCTASGSAFANQCVQLADLCDDDPQLREHLLELARVDCDD